MPSLWRTAGVFLEHLESRLLLSTSPVIPAFKVYQPVGAAQPMASASPSGVTPATMRHAYGVDQVMFGTIRGDGTGQTIAIVDAYDLPTAVTDLDAFDAQYSLPPPPSFKIVNQTGGASRPAADAPGGWGVEIALDIEWAHVMAPNASILLVEANSANDSDLYTAVDTARNYTGVSAVSMSWGGDETYYDSTYDYHFSHTGVTFLASTGDYGAYSKGTTNMIVGYPAASPNVVAVGGTTLTTGTGGAWSSESGWGYGASSGTAHGSGGGISQYASQPAYQNGVVTQSTTKRTVPDISLDADPNSGVPVYSAYDNGASTPWAQYGGTSLSSPMWAGIIAVVNQGRVNAGLTTLDGRTQTLPKLYALPASDFHDVTTGNNGYAAAAGYDLVTGIGTPIVNLLVNDLVGACTIGSFTAGSAAVTSGGYVSLYAKNVATTGTSSIAGVRFYRESNSTTGLQAATDTYVGMGVRSGTTWTFAAPTTGLSGTQTYYAVAYDNLGNSSLPSSLTASITASGFSNWSTLQPFMAQVPLSIGSIASTSVVNSGTTVYTGALDTTITLDRLRGDNGPDGSGDGALFTNIGTPPLPMNRGDFYQFTIDPQTGSSPSFTSGQVPFPGPMRLMINTSGDVYFTGDDYATDLNLYVAGTPSLGSFAASPSSVISGSSFTLTAANVSETISPSPDLNANTGSNVLASVSNVQFYLDTNGTAGLQTGTDLLLGRGTQSGSTWTLSNVASTGLAAGTYTLYAVAVDPAGNTVAQSSSLTVTSAPSIGAFTLNPTTVIVGTATSLTASNVTDAGSTISAVNFYRESNGTTGLQIGSDTLVGTGTQNGTTWTISAPTTGLAVGTYTYYAVATDATGVSTAPSSATLTVTGPPTIGSFALSPTSVISGSATTLTASNVTEAGGTISNVKFYRESNSTSGLQIGSDTLVGTGTQNGTTWTISASTTGLAAGTYTYYAVATDAAGSSSTVASTTLSVTAGPPTIGSFTLSPTSVASGSSTTLTASNVTEAGGAISNVVFYRESNGTTGLQIGSDTLVGAGTQNGTTWTISASTTGLAAGPYTYYAVATDATSVSTAPSAAALTVTGAPSIGAFTLSPTTVIIGTAATLTASNVTDIGSTISAVSFYRDSNGTTGLQIGSDTLVGAGTQNGTTWTISASTAGLAAGAYTYYAVATDASGTSTSASLAVLTVIAADTQLSWNVTGQTIYGTQGLAATAVAPSVTNSAGLTRGSGVSASGSGTSNAWGGYNWSQSTAAAGISANQYVTFALTVAPSLSLSLSAIDMNYRRGSHGPGSGDWQYSINAGSFAEIGISSFSSSSNSGAVMPEVPLSGIAALQNLSPGTVVTFRLVPYGASSSSSSSGSWYVYHTASTGDDLLLKGTAIADPPGLTRGPGARFVITGSPGSQTLDVTAGTITLTADLSATFPGLGLKIEDGAHVVLSSDQTLSGLQVLGAGSLDVQTHTVTLNYTGAPGPRSAIEGYLASGYHSGAWNGAGIVTSSADATHGVGCFDTGSAITIVYTLNGDICHDGVVNYLDYGVIDNAYLHNQSNPTSPEVGYAHGDLDFDGVINYLDYGIMDSTFLALNAPAAAGAAAAVAPPLVTPAVVAPTVVTPGVFSTTALARKPASDAVLVSPGDLGVLA